MQLTVLGACGAGPEAGQACSGYLIEHRRVAAAAEAPATLGGIGE
jgi:hypothetical protein